MKRAVTTGALLCGAIGAVLVFACSPDPGPFFTTPAYPENQAAFDRGRIGLVTPALRTENELLAFRILSGLKLEGDGDQHGPAAEWQNPQNTWMQARRAVPDPKPPDYINASRVNRSAGQFVYYQNCLDDAFVTAARTLTDRRQHYPSKQALVNWVGAQDQVFANCNSDKPVYPQPAATGATPLERADREYQIAAAHFYTEDFEDAARRFRAIAADRKSPWQQVGAYMVGRTLLREVSLQKNASALTLARQQFAKVAADSAAGNLGVSARGLLEHLDAIENTGSVMDSLSKKLLLPRTTPQDFAAAVRESAYILKADSFRPALAQPNLPEPFDWVHTLERGTAAHALEKWKAGHSLPWLVLALIHADGKSPAAPALMSAAGQLKPGSPAFGTAAYNAIRLRLERGETEIARQQLDQILAGRQGQPDSLVNGWRAERMRVATSFGDLLHWAPRKPVSPGFYVANDPAADSAVLAEDAVILLDYSTPLSKLREAAHSSELPPWSASVVALAAWTRAVVIDDLEAARDLAAVVAKTHPDWAANLTPPDIAPPDTDVDAWKFRAALLISQHREFDPMIAVDYRKPVGAWWRSWWCPVEPLRPGTLASYLLDRTVSWRLPAIFQAPDAVLSPPERETAKVEFERLQQAGSAPAFLAHIIFQWAQTHPRDPLVPQALHRLVMVVRYGCHRPDPSNPHISKRAFELLRRRYPKSPWTAKTPYWFD